MKLEMRKKYSEDLGKKIVLLIFLLIIFLINLVYVSFYKNVNSDFVNEEKESEIIDTQDEIVETTEVHTETDSTSIISNLGIYAVPLLGEKTVLLDECLQNYFTETNQEVKNAEIFYVMMPEANRDHLYFFVKISSTNEIVQLTYDYETSSAFCSICEYTEEEIMNESWQSNEPSIRDIH